MSAFAEGRGKLFNAEPLPTRTRPGPRFDPERDWTEFGRLLLKLLPLAAAEQDAACALSKQEERYPTLNWSWINRFCLAHPNMRNRVRDAGRHQTVFGGQGISDAQELEFRLAIPALRAEATTMRDEAAAWLRAQLTKPSAPLDGEGVRLWVRQLLAVCPDMGQRYFGEGLGAHRAACRLCFTHFARWLAASSGVAAVLAVVDGLRPTAMALLDALPTSPWDVPTTLGLRSSLTCLSEADYEAAVEACSRLHDADRRPEFAAFLACVLADDRPHARHALRAGPVLETHAGPVRSYGASRALVALIVDLPPSAAASWRARKDVAFEMAACDVTVAEAAATLVAVAHGAGETATPSLVWFMRDLAGTDRRLVAKALLETRDDGALASLLPFMNNKLVRDAVDAAERAYPAWTFGQVLSAAADRNDVALLGRVTATVARHGVDTARAWARDAGRRAADLLERILARREATFAPPETWPPFLREPPWRRNRGNRTEIVLKLAPIPTPFGLGMDAPPRNTHQERRSRVLADLSELAPLIHEIETGPAFSRRETRLAVETLPALDAPVELALEWLRRRLHESLEADTFAIAWRYESLYLGIASQPEPLSLLLWNVTHVVRRTLRWWRHIVAAMMARFGAQAVPGLLGLLEADPVHMLPQVVRVDAADLAPVMARAFLRSKHARPAAADWLRRHPHTAAMRLLPDALGAPGPVRDTAERVLRWLITDQPGGRATLDAAVAEYAAAEPRVTQAVAQGLLCDPMERVPARPPKAPDWARAVALSRPVLRAGGALPDDAITAVIEMASFSSSTHPYAGVEALRDACTPGSLDAFGSDLLLAWAGAGAHPAGGWVLAAVATLGGDRCARELTRLIRVWAAKGWRARTFAGLDALAALGSDVALINLKAVADKNPSPAVRHHAAVRIAAVADARGLSPEELADRLTPDLGLDERGGLDLDFGPRRFRVGFDEFLSPWVRDEAGSRLKLLPRPSKTDTAERAAAATKRWAGLKKDAVAVAALQLSRLESMLATSRRLDPPCSNTSLPPTRFCDTWQAGSCGASSAARTRVKRLGSPSGSPKTSA